MPPPLRPHPPHPTDPSAPGSPTDPRLTPDTDPPFDPDEPVPFVFEDELDLHRFHPRDAPALVRDWLSDRRQAGRLGLRLVHGKGTGQLRARVHGILRGSGLVRELREDGNWGGVSVGLWDPAQDAPRLAALLAGMPRWVAALEALAEAGPPDAWLGAGALRNRVWHHLHGRPGEPEDRDLDVAWAGPADTAEDAAWTARLRERLDAPWEVVDQRRYGHADALAGVASWPETATTVAARLGSAGAGAAAVGSAGAGAAAVGSAGAGAAAVGSAGAGAAAVGSAGSGSAAVGAEPVNVGGVVLHAAWGWEDLWAMVVRPRPGLPAEAWRARLAAKRWRERFPGVVVERS